MVVKYKKPEIVCYVCEYPIRVAIFDETMAAFICTDCLPHCFKAGTELVRAGMSASSAQPIPE